MSEQVKKEVVLPPLEDTHGLGAVPVADALRQRELQLAKQIERNDRLDAELNEGDSWAWIRRKFNNDGHVFRWWTPRTDSLTGTRYEVMGWLHCLFGDAAYNRCLVDICVEQQKKAHEAEAQAAGLVTQIEHDRKRFSIDEAALTAEVKRVESQRDEHFSEIKRAQEIIDGQVVLNRENESKIAGMIVQVEEYDTLHQTLSKILTNTANELHGGPLENGMWSWHDLAELAKTSRERAEKSEAQVELLKKACDVNIQGSADLWSSELERRFAVEAKLATANRLNDAMNKENLALVAELRDGATVTYRVEFWQEPYKKWQDLISPVPTTEQEARAAASDVDGEGGYTKGRAFEITTRERILDTTEIEG